jgi:hypothetical protein
MRRKLRSTLPGHWLWRSLHAAPTIAVLRDCQAATRGRSRLDPQGVDLYEAIAGFDRLQEAFSPAELTARRGAVPRAMCRALAIGCALWADDVLPSRVAAASSKLSDIAIVEEVIMDLLRVTHALQLVCVGVAVSACYQHSRQSLETSRAVEKIQAVDAQPAEERLDAFFGDRFSEVQKALASRPPEPDVPSF